jgi:AAA15 family ATPase/GTPase
MLNLGNVGVWIKSFKSFGPERAGFDIVKNVNVIIGRNNSGKSALIDPDSIICIHALNCSTGTISRPLSHLRHS